MKIIKGKEKDTLLMVKDKLESYIKEKGDQLNSHLYKILISTLVDLGKD